MAGRPETVLEILNASEAWLAARGVDAPKRSAELMLCAVLGVDRLRLYLDHDRPLSADEKTRLRALVARRGGHEPLAYVLGSWEFYGHELEVGPDVLVPRPETEGLVERAIARAPEGARCVDLGTGSGAIAIALALERPDVTVWAVDKSAAALAVARRNVARHGLEARVHLVGGSFWEPLRELEPFDLLVSNPPYVDPARPELLADDVRRFEPAAALFTPPGRPGAAYEAIAAEAGERLVAGAWLLFESGEGAVDAAKRALASAAGIVEVAVEDDLEGRPRYLMGRVWSG